MPSLAGGGFTISFWLSKHITTVGIHHAGTRVATRVAHCSVGTDGRLLEALERPPVRGQRGRTRCRDAQQCLRLLHGVGDSAVWIAATKEVDAQKSDLLCIGGIGGSGVIEHYDDLQKKLGGLCDTIFARSSSLPSSS